MRSMGPEGRDGYEYLRALPLHRRFRRSVRLQALLRAKGDAQTGIKRADTTNEVQYSPWSSTDRFCRCFAERDGSSATHLAVDAVTLES